MTNTLATIIDSTGTVINLSQYPNLWSIITITCIVIIAAITIYTIIKRNISKTLIQVRSLIQIILDATSDRIISEAELTEILKAVQALFVTNKNVTVEQVQEFILTKVHQLRITKEQSKKK